MLFCSIKFFLQHCRKAKVMRDLISLVMDYKNGVSCACGGFHVVKKKNHNG